MVRQPDLVEQSPLRNRLFRSLYGLLFLAILAAGVYYILAYLPGIRNSGSLVPVGDQTVAYQQLGQTVFITSGQQMQLNLFGAAFAMSLLLWLLAGILFEMQFKIPLFRQAPRRGVSPFKPTSRKATS